MSFFPEECAAFACSQCAVETIAITGNPRCWAPIAISTTTGPDAAGGDHDEGIVLAEMKSTQDLLGIAFVIFEIQRRAQAVGADDIGMI